jgi:hypothetical protein
MNFWNQLESQKISDQAEIKNCLIQKLGSPQTELQTNLLLELTKKVGSYYLEVPKQNYSSCFLFGLVQEISQKKFKEGKNLGQPYYILKLLSEASKKETVQARKEDLPEDKWSQVEQLAVLGQNLVFKYRKFFNHRQIIDFYPQAKEK